MRVLAIIALGLLLAGCNGDRMKQGMSMRQAQTQSGAAAGQFKEAANAASAFVV